MTRERRQHVRQKITGSAKRDIRIGLPGSINPQRAVVIDISKAGIGLSTDVKLNVGQIVIFLDQTIANYKLPDTGTVMWSLHEKNKCTVGIKFS